MAGIFLLKELARAASGVINDIASDVIRLASPDLEQKASPLEIAARLSDVAAELYRISKLE